ncbi:response regulator transcription factor [Chlamydiota bacterium]
MKKRILLVEDDETLIEGLKDNLEIENFEVVTAVDGDTGLEKGLHENFDLILLDVMLPGMNGFDICKTLRKKNIRTPVIMLTARGQEVDKVVGLEIGADDYITKPFSLRELIARIKAIFRRSNGKVAHIDHYEFDDVVIDFKSYVITKHNKKYEFTSSEFQILKYLIEHKDEVVSREELISMLWGTDSYVTTRTIDNHIVKLRKGIEKDPANPKHFLTIRGVGYKFV